MDQKKEKNKNLERRGVAVIGVGGGHHLLELLKVDISIAIRIDGSDHPVAIFDGAIHAQTVEDEVELGGGDEAVLVLIVELERVAELGDSAVFCGAGAAEGGELGQGNEAVVVGVELFHDAAELVFVGEGGAEGAEDGAELRHGDLAVAVGVEAVEDFLDFFRALDREG